jgi:hypothetical protein
MRAVNRLGWSGGGGSTPLPAYTTIVTGGYPYTIVPLTARSFTPPRNVNPKAAFFTEIDLTTYRLVECWAFPVYGVDQLGRAIHITLPIQASQLDVSSPSFKVAIQWFQISDAVTPSPAKVVKWDVGIRNDYYLSDIRSDATYTDTISKEVGDAYDMQGGDDLDDEKTIAVSSISGSALSATKMNWITLSIRRSFDPTDDYNATIYLPSASLQFKNNFANVAAWGT